METNKITTTNVRVLIAVFTILEYSAFSIALMKI